MSELMQKAAEAVLRPDVQSMIKELSKHGLGVFIPHAHTEEGFVPLERDMVQLERDLVVSFVKKDSPMLKNATTVGWVWDATEARAVSACACSGRHFPGHD